MVILLIGISASLISLTVPTDDSLSGIAVSQAEKLVYVMEEISDRASMEGRVLGLKVSKNGYKFLYLSPNGKKKVQSDSLEQQLFLTYWDTLSWVPYSIEGIDTDVTFEEGITATLKVGGRNKR